MSELGFCTACGAPRPADARFCTSCGASFSGAPSAAGRAAGPSRSTPVAALAAGALLLGLGGVAVYFALQGTTEVPRAVSGSPDGGRPPAGAPGAGAAGGDLPSGHPSIDLPKEVIAFLDGLTAEAEKDPKSVDAAQKLLRARYRASVINASYRVSAQQALDKLLALDPNNAEGLRISANLAYDASDYPEAEKRFEAFLAKFPDDVSAITDLGSAELFQDRVDDAIKTYRAAIAKDGKFMQAHFNLGIALQKKGSKDEAIASLRKALELAEDPDERQHVENAIAELEGREPMQIAGARGSSPKAGGAPAGGAGGMPPGAPGASGAAPGAASGAAPGAASGGMQGGMPMPPPAPDRAVPTNAGTDFQRHAEKPLITHPIVGPRVASFEWTGPASVRVKIADFPMDRMPPFARAKFKSGMTEKMQAVATADGVAGAVTVEIVDNASGAVMETLDTSAAGAAAAAPGAPK